MIHQNLVVISHFRTMNGGPPPLQVHGEPILEMGQLQQQQLQQLQHEQRQQHQHEQQQQHLGLSQAAAWVDEPHTAEIGTISR